MFVHNLRRDIWLTLVLACAFGCIPQPQSSRNAPSLEELNQRNQSALDQQISESSIASVLKVPKSDSSSPQADALVQNDNRTNPLRGAAKTIGTNSSGAQTNVPVGSGLANQTADNRPDQKRAKENLESRKNSLTKKSDKDEPDEKPDRKYEPLFSNWPQPKLVLFLTGQQMGYLEPCGCTGLANQKGGLARRLSLYQSLVDRGWNVVALDVGNQVRRFGRQAEIQFQMTAEALKKIGYKAVALGADDLRLTSGELAAATMESAVTPTIFTSANTAVLDRSFTPAFQIISLAGLRIGVASVVGKSYLEKVTNSEIVRSSPTASVRSALKEFSAAQSNLRILLAHADIAESKQFARDFQEFQIVVTAGGDPDPPHQPEPVDKSDSLFVEVGTKGMYVTVVGVYDDPKTPYRYQRVPLDDRFRDAQQMLDILATYQDQLKISGLDGLGLKPIPHPSGRKFVGSNQCGECHTKAMSVFSNTTHATATESIVHPRERAAIQRHFDPECLSCHVTGWNPQKFFPYSSGYLALDSTPELVGNGCENCHGPGSAHVAAESGETEVSADKKKLLREQMRLPLNAAEQKCFECHDVDNSPDFQKPGAFQKYWKQIEHKGLD